MSKKKTDRKKQAPTKKPARTKKPAPRQKKPIGKKKPQSQKKPGLRKPPSAFVDHQEEQLEGALEQETAAEDLEPAAIQPLASTNQATVTGILIDSDLIAWARAAWTCVATSPSSPPVFADGSGPVPATSGVLDAVGTFSGQIPRTDSIVPVGTTLTFTIASRTSAPPVVVPGILAAAANIDLGAILSPLVTAPRMEAAALVYAYDEVEILNPTNGNGYLNTTTNQSFIYNEGAQEWDLLPLPPDVAMMNLETNQGNFFMTGNLDVGGTIGNPAALIDGAGNGTFNGSIIAGNGKVGVVQLSTSGASSFLDAHGGTLFINQNVGGTPSVQINGTLFANGTKNFRIVHPLDPAKNLVHACVEGPEAAVFYRGEGETSGGRAEISLPDYFEALTLPTHRTVQLTLLVDDDDPVFGGAIAAGRVTNGKFRVYSTDPTAHFYWEVKAIRRDIDRLTVEPARSQEEINDAKVH